MGRPMKRQSRKPPVNLQVIDRIGPRWFIGPWTIKQLGNEFFAWSHDYDEGLGTGRELGPFRSLADATKKCRTEP